jgi:beta-phosphoglucomutase-like phosphatase (HAD superfamily)
VLGLPDGISACLFDLDGVLTTTAELHARIWKQMFDAFLAERGEPPFELPGDYEQFVDGKPRLDGVRSFLASRGIDADERLVGELGDRKNEIVLGLIRGGGAKVYDGSLRYVHAARDGGLRCAVALAGVEAGRRGDFGIVVGVDRTGQAGALRERGADVVVADLDELLDRAP